MAGRTRHTGHMGESLAGALTPRNTPECLRPYLHRRAVIYDLPDSFDLLTGNGDAAVGPVVGASNIGVWASTALAQNCFSVYAKWIWRVSSPNRSMRPTSPSGNRAIGLRFATRITPKSSDARSYSSVSPGMNQFPGGILLSDLCSNRGYVTAAGSGIAPGENRASPRKTSGIDCRSGRSTLLTSSR
jgi:hypothetical protein